MSAKWMGYFFDDTDLKGSLLLLALAIADHADADGSCNPGLAKLSKKIRVGKRQTKVLFRQLEAAGHVTSIRGVGRKHKSWLQLKKVNCSAPFNEAFEEDEQPLEMVQSGAPIADEKWCAPEQGNGALQNREMVRSSASPPTPPSYEPVFKPVSEPKSFQKPPKKITGSIESEVAVWMSVLAPLVGAKSVDTIANAWKWRDVCTSGVREGFTVTQFVDAVKLKLESTADCQQFFTPNGVLQQMQLGRLSTAPVSTSGSLINQKTGRTIL